MLKHQLGIEILYSRMYIFECIQMLFKFLSGSLKLFSIAILYIYSWTFYSFFFLAYHT